MNEQETAPPISEPSDRRRMFVGFSILAGIILVLVIAVVILLFVDPFDWNLLGGAERDVALEAIPTDSLMYVHIDLDRLDDENLEAIVRALSPEPLPEDTTFLDQQLEELDAWLVEELNLTYSEDLRPWMGNDVGLGVWELMASFSGGSQEEGILIVVEVDDEGAADDFLDRAVTEVEAQGGGTVQEETYENQTIYFFEEETLSNLAICRSGNLMLISEGVSSIQKGIDAQIGESLADLENYQEAVDALPTGQIATMYLDMMKYQESMAPLLSLAYSPGMSDLVSESSGVAAFVAVGVSVVDVGVKIDYSIVADPELQAELPEGYFNDDPQIAALAPEDTFFYFASGIKVENLEQTRESVLQLLSTQGTDAEEAMAMFTMAFGFDLIDDLIGNLDGELAFLLMPAAEGVLAESMGVPLGFVILAETDKPQKLLTVADDFSAAMERQGMGEAEVSEQEFGTIYDLVDMFNGDLIVTYGVSEEHLMIGSSSDILADLFSGGSSLADSDSYEEVWDAFPGDMAPILYINIEDLVGQIRESMEPWEREDFDEEAGAVLEAMNFFAAAVAPPKDNITLATFILFVEME